MINLIKVALGAVKGSWVNIALVLAVVSALTGFVIYYDTARFNAGYNQAVVDLQDSSQEAVEASTRAFKAEAIQRLRVHDKELTEANRLVQELLERKPDVLIKEIPVAVEASECKRIGEPSRLLINAFVNSK